ncbi:MAG: serine/threonine-protein kinase, partial [bacterium]
RQALALMDHPCIARIFVADTTEDGRPYFTMEYVTGMPITEYCDSNRLPVAERLRLFLRVCDGVQHAHQKGILHRDLKPSNILVAIRDHEPVPKIIDFGVAKALHQPLTESSVKTAHGFLVGTPDYMSPEQAASNGEDVDTRADIYSLGVLLYQLLCGVLPIDPHDLRAGSNARIQHRIITEEPSPPSRRLAQTERAAEIAGTRGQQPRGLGKLLQHDLDWITMKALAKDRAERYPTVSDFAADILRFLSGEPVVAGPPSPGYRVRKFVRKYRVSLVAAVAVLCALVAGLVASLNFAYRAESALEIADINANQARQSALKAEKITEYMKSVLLKASPHRGGSPDMAIREALTEAEAGLDNILTAAPEINAAVRVTMAEIYHSLCLYDKAIHHAGLAVDDLRQAPAANPRDLAWGLRIMALSRHDQGDLTAARDLHQESLAVYRERLGEDSPVVLDILTDLVGIQSQIGSYQEAESSYRELIAHQERLLGPDDLAIGMSLIRFGSFLGGNAYYTEGEKHLRRAGTILERVLGDGHPDTAMGRYYLGLLYRKQGNFSAAIPLLQTATDSLRTQLGATHRQTLMAQCDLAAAWSGQGWHARAESLFAVTAELQQVHLGASNFSLSVTALYRGDNHRELGETDRAHACYAEATRIITTLLPDSDHSLKARLLQQQAILDEQSGAFALARRQLERALEQHLRLLRPDHPRTIENLAALTRICSRQDDLPAALSAAEQYVAAVHREFGPRHAQVDSAARWNIELNQRRGKAEAAAAWSAWLITDRTGLPVIPN